MTMAPAHPAEVVRNGRVPLAERIMLKPAQAAQLLWINDRTLRGWASAGLTPPKIQLSTGGEYYSREHLDHWVRWGCPGRDGFLERLSALTEKRAATEVYETQ